LENEARACNIFWLAEGAISMGAFTSMRGTTIAHNGANNMGANGAIEGRMLSTAGAVGFTQQQLLMIKISAVYHPIIIILQFQICYISMH